MPRLDESAGAALRDRLDASATRRQTQGAQRRADSHADQTERLEAARERAREAAQAAVNMQVHLGELHDRRAQETQRQVRGRRAEHEARRARIQETLETLSEERSLMGAKRSADRAKARGDIRAQTEAIVGGAARERAAMRADLQAFSAQMRRTAPSVSSAAVVIRQPRAQANLRGAAALPSSATVKKAAVSAMGLPEPMATGLRRRENVVLKMIGAHPGITSEGLLEHLYLNAGELREILKKLTVNGKVSVVDGAYRLGQGQ
jgi:hypothetical protein